jgi:hypothetical protein
MKVCYLFNGNLLALEDLDLCVELGDLGLHDGLLLDDLLLLPGHPLNLLLQLHHRRLVFRPDVTFVRNFYETVTVRVCQFFNYHSCFDIQLGYFLENEEIFR